MMEVRWVGVGRFRGFYGAYFGKESAVMIFVAAPHRCFKAQLIRLLRRDLR